MAVVISYSHEDKDFVDRIAVALVKARAQVWLDRWELNVGDSLTQRIQAAIQDADALLVVLSPAAVVSEWCKRELSAGLVRELEERRVVVLPLLYKNCDMPLFLRDKLYADFSTDFDSGLEAVLRALARVITVTRARVDDPKWHTDWAMDWGLESGCLRVTITYVDQAQDRRFTAQTIVTALGNECATKRYLAYMRAELGWFVPHVVMEMIADAVEFQNLRVVLGDRNPQAHGFSIGDLRLGTSFDVRIECRILGEDSGFDVSLDVANLLRESKAHIRRSSRKLTIEEQNRVENLIREIDS